MFEKTQKAANELAGAVAEETTQAFALAKATVIPAVGDFFGKIADAANKLKEGVENGDLFKASETEASADPLPTEAQNSAIKVLRSLNKDDEEIARIIGVSVRTVKMASSGE